MKKREKKYLMRQVPIDQEESKWQCETCSAPTEGDWSRWCLSCRLYWEDCRLGLFSDDNYAAHYSAERPGTENVEEDQS